MDALLFTEFGLALGEEERERLRMQYDNYQYYEGRQHRDENGELVEAEDLERPAGLDYDPTRYATNYFKAIINRKARWQMGGKHAVVVPRKQIDELEETLEPDYEPSAEQVRANEIAEGYEELLRKIWRENKMHARLLQAARDRLIAERVVCKIAFNPDTGKIRWIFRPDTEYFPVYSDDDFEELIACHFIRQVFVEVDGEEEEGIRKQTFRLEGEGETRTCTIEEAIYLIDDLEKPYEVIQPKQTMDLDFIPVVEVPVNDLLAETDAQSEVADLRRQNDVLNQMNEDAIDSIKFEMFSMTVVKNAPQGTAQSMRIAPGAVIELTGGVNENTSPDIKKVENGFKWKDAFADQYDRVKSAMHEISGLPVVNPKDLNFGGMNGDALQIVFHDIITDTEEHWLAWDYALQEIHEKTIRYLQARLGEPNFAYDKDVVRAIEDYTTEMRFTLPLPDNRKELVELLSLEMAAQVESQTGAMQRLGVEDVKAKKEEIQREQAQMFAMQNPYGAEGEAPVGEAAGVQALKTNAEGKLVDPESGEPVEICPVCEGSGQELDPNTGEYRTCQNCRGDGYVQVRKR